MPSGSASATRAASRGTSHAMSARSADTLPSMPGRRTFTATSWPSWSRARCTTATDARPIGSGSKSAKSSSRLLPVARSTSARTRAKDTARPWSSSERNSSDTSGPNTDGADATSWPNFT